MKGYIHKYYANKVDLYSSNGKGVIVVWGPTGGYFTALAPSGRYARKVTITVRNRETREVIFQDSRTIPKKDDR